MVELLVAVAMLGILATIAQVYVRKYITASKYSEAKGMIGLIRSGQDQYMQDRSRYLNVSSSIDDFYPKNSKPGQQKMNFPGNSGSGLDAWQTLDVHMDAPVLFVYSCIAGGAGGKPETGDGITVTNWPSTMDRPWYVVKAQGDVDGDGVNTVFLSASFDREIFSANE